VLYGQIRKELGELFHRFARQKESLIEEGHIMGNHVHMMISIPPKYAVSQVIGFIKGKAPWENSGDSANQQDDSSPYSGAVYLY
jgi:REP element-mobilizing transposase RayT